MALVIEDGTNVPNADSFATIAELTDYAAGYGFAVPATDAEKEEILRRAALQMQVLKWKGGRANLEQSLSWPRADVCVDGEILPNNLIPARIQYGQLALACEIYQDDLNPPEAAKGPVVREKVDVIEVQYGPANGVSPRLLPAAPDRQSRAQFADYLTTRGLFVVRA